MPAPCRATPSRCFLRVFLKKDCWPVEQHLSLLLSFFLVSSASREASAASQLVTSTGGGQHHSSSFASEPLPSIFILRDISALLPGSSHTSLLHGPRRLPAYIICSCPHPGIISLFLYPGAGSSESAVSSESLFRTRPVQPLHSQLNQRLLPPSVPSDHLSLTSACPMSL